MHPRPPSPSAPQVNDTVMLDLETGKIKDFIKFDVGNLVRRSYIGHERGLLAVGWDAAGEAGLWLLLLWSSKVGSVEPDLMQGMRRSLACSVVHTSADHRLPTTLPPHSQAIATGGHNNGRVGTIVHKEKHKGSFDIVHIKDAGEHKGPALGCSSPCIDEGCGAR